MNYYPKYLSLLNRNMVGGEVSEILYNKGTILNAVMTWNIQYNRFLKLPLMLQLVKLSKETIRDKIIKNPVNYEIFLNLLLIAIDTHDQYFKDKYPTLYEKYLSENYLHTDPPSLSTTKHVVYVKNLINFFIETHKSIDQLLAINNQQLDAEKAKDVQEFLGISRDYYYTWRINLNKYYGEKDFMGLPPRDRPDGTKEPIPQQAEPNKANSLHAFLTSKETGITINDEYNKLSEKKVISYLRVRLDEDELAAKQYNHRYNVYLEDLKGKSRLTTPQSMFLTGPKPYHNIYYYQKNKNGPSAIPTLKQLRDTPGNFPNYDVNDYADLETNKETGDVENVKKFSYGNLYGPLTRIFPPQENNNQISKDCIEIVNQLKDNKSIVVMGVGASGGGKSSVLLYFKKGKPGQKDGVLLNILKNPELGNIPKITVSFHELYGNADTAIDEHKSRNYDDIIFEKDADGVYNISAETLGGKDSIGGEYTEKVRTQISDTQYEEIKNSIIKEITEQHPVMEDKIVNGRPVLNDMGKPVKQKKSYGKDPKGNDVYVLDDGYKYLIEERVSKINDIIWTETIYKWTITTVGGKVVFTGKDTLDDNIKDINKKLESVVDGSNQQKQLTILKEKYAAMKTKNQKIYDPRLLCIADKDGNLDDEDKDLCDPANWKDKPIQIKSLGMFCLGVSDRIRMINPTTNNDVSSRSHGIFYIKLPYVNGNTVDYTKNPKYFIVADLAGVEDQFICKSPDTQAAFLNLDYINRITGKPIKGPPVLGEDGNQLIDEDGKPRFQKIPHYTTNTKLSWTSLPNDEKSQKILEFLGYDPINKIIKNQADYDTKMSLLKVFSKQYNMHNENGLIAPFKVDFEDTGVDSTQIFKDFQGLGLYEDFNTIMTKNESILRSNPLNNSTGKKKAEQIYLQITGSDLVLKPSDISTYGSNLAALMMLKVSPQVVAFKTNYDIYIRSLSSAPPQGILNQKQIKQALKTPTNIRDMPQNVFDSITQFYIQRYPNFADVLNNAFADANLMFGTTNTKGLYQKLEDNLSIFQKSGVEQLCNERMHEGKFINAALIGAAQSISLLIQNLSAAADERDEGLVKNIPLVREACFKFYCHRDHETCFNQYVNDNITKYNDAILSNIREMIGDQIKTLKIAVFAVLNINRKASDYQKVPYIDTNGLKELRNQYITYAHFLQENNETFKQSLVADVKKILFGTGTAESPDKDTIFDILNRFKDNIGVILSEAPKNIYKKFEVPDSNFFKILVELIAAIDVVTSLSYVGTMDFLNSVKNVYSTDAVCKLETRVDKRDYSEPIDDYVNIVTKEALYVELTRQTGKKPSNLKLQGQILETEKLPKGVAQASSSKVLVAPPKGKLLSIDSILGGYIDSRSSNINQKDELINEYKQLKKMYRRIKNNVI
jgi:hypothetical protein